MRLLAKFSLIFLVVFGLGLSASAWLFYGLLQRNAREQVLHQAQIMMETALAMRNYTTEQVRPVIADLTPARGERAGNQALLDMCAGLQPEPKRIFRPQGVPAFAATEMFGYLRKRYPDYMYKEAALNPTNPANRALDWEEDIIKAFRGQPDLAAFDGERATPVGRALVLARPMRAARSCLDCHDTPATAPPEMVQRYGASNGYGWREGEVIAAQIVSVPVSLPVKMADQAFRQLLVSLVAVGLLTLLVLDLVLYATVIRPVSRLAGQADLISKGQMDVQELPVRGKDEIAVLASAFNRMHRSLSAALKMLDSE